MSDSDRRARRVAGNQAIQAVVRIQQPVPDGISDAVGHRDVVEVGVTPEEIEPLFLVGRLDRVNLKRIPIDGDGPRVLQHAG